MGRCKIEIEKIEDIASRHVAFSKRRNGVFKKAFELGILTGVEVVVITFSPGGKLYAYGSPTVETIIDRFSNLNQVLDPNTQALVDAHHRAIAIELIRQCVELENQLVAENEKEEQLRDMKKDKSPCWSKEPIKNLDYDQLECLRSSLEVVKKNISDELINREFGLSNNPMDAKKSTNLMSIMNSKNSIGSEGPSTGPGIPHGYGYGFGGHYLQ